MEKATFRLPEWELERMRERSRQERRSLNAVVSDVIARGLGQAPATPGQTAVVAALGPLLVRPAQQRYEHEDEEPSTARLTDALDWTRGDR
jgi:hypothetical protein